MKPSNVEMCGTHRKMSTKNFRLNIDIIKAHSGTQPKLTSFRVSRNADGIYYGETKSSLPQRYCHGVESDIQNALSVQTSAGCYALRQA